MKYDFGKIIDRRNTNALKYDIIERCGLSKDTIPMWVADTDFAAPPQILEALHNAVSHGVFGYSEPKSSYFETLKMWLNRRYNLVIQREWLVHCPGIVFAITMAIRAYTKEGDGVLIQQPVYYPFRSMVVSNKRKLIVNSLVSNKTTGKYEVDFGDLEQKIIKYKPKLFVLCSPHNPVGRVWTTDELRRMGELCLRHNVIVLSDEIHADLTLTGKHTIYGSISKELSDNCIIATAPSKTFNIAGLQFSDILISNPRLRAAFVSQINASGYSQLNTLGIVAAEAAYTHGEPWLDEQLAYLRGNAELIESFVSDRLPKVRYTRPEATYLAWLDFGAYGMSQTELEDLITNKAQLYLSSGTIFGKEGEGFMRLNFGCSRVLLTAALDRLAKAMDGAVNI